MDLSKSRVEVKAKGPNGRPYATVEVPSDSNPNKKYVVDLVNVRCSCPGWIYRKGGRKLCKHLRALGYTESQQEGPKPVTQPAAVKYEELL